MAPSTRFRRRRAEHGTGPVESIQEKRDGGELTGREIAGFIAAFMDGSIADYQMSALLMAVFFRGLDDAETVALTEAMLHSGDVLDLGERARAQGRQALDRRRRRQGLDLPRAARRRVRRAGADGVAAAASATPAARSTSSRRSPAFASISTSPTFARIVREVGRCMIGQTRAHRARRQAHLRAARRDRDGRVDSAHRRQHPVEEARRGDRRARARREGRARRVHERPRRRARARRKLWCASARAAGKQVVALLTDMDAPLGRTRRQRERDARGARGPARPRPGRSRRVHARARRRDARARRRREEPTRRRAPSSRAAIASGAAARVMERMVAAQGGDPRVVHDPRSCPRAPAGDRDLPAPKSGYVAVIDAREVGSRRGRRSAPDERAPIRRSIRRSGSKFWPSRATP